MWRIVVGAVLVLSTRAVSAEPPRTPPPLPCEGRDFEQEADDAFEHGMFAFALSRYEGAVRCNARIGLVFKAGLAACSLHRAAPSTAAADKAMLFYHHLPRIQQVLLAFVCRPLVLE